jgi:hypothetical protein
MHRLNIFAVIAALTLFAAGLLPWMAVAAPESASSIEQTFQKAKKDYLEKNMQSASEQLQKSASFMKAEAAHASEKGKAALSASAKELEKLADDVKKGTVTSVKRMEETFARAYGALAADSHIKSTESWARKEQTKAGEALDSANKYLERGFSWAGEKVENNTKKALTKSKELSLKLKKKGGMVAEDVGKGLKNAGNEIETFGKKISPK